MKEQIAKVLLVPVEKVDSRIVGMGLGETCSRCGGSGHYSFNPIDGTRCFKCAGKGNLVPTSKKGLAEVLKNAQAAVESGALDTYLAKLRETAIAAKAENTVMAAWERATKIILDGRHYTVFCNVAPDSELAQRSNSNRRIYEANEALVKEVRTSKKDTAKIVVLMNAALEVIKAEVSTWENKPFPLP